VLQIKAGGWHVIQLDSGGEVSKRGNGLIALVARGRGPAE